MITFKKLFLLLFILPFAAQSEELLLQCQVSGKWNEERLDPATLLVSVSEVNNNLYVDIDGPQDYQIGITSKNFTAKDKIYFGRNDSSANLHCM